MIAICRGLVTTTKLINLVRLRWWRTMVELQEKLGRMSDSLQENAKVSDRRSTPVAEFLLVLIELLVLMPLTGNLGIPAGGVTGYNGRID